MGLLFFSFGLEICAFDGIGEVEDEMHPRSEMLGEMGEEEEGESELGIGVVRIVNCTDSESSEYTGMQEDIL